MWLFYVELLGRQYRQGHRSNGRAGISKGVEGNRNV